MSEPIPSLSANILALPQVSHIQLATDAITKAGSKPAGGQQLSTHNAACIYQVPCSTLGDYMKGLQMHAEVHINQQNLSPAQEEVLVKWAKMLGRHRVPFTMQPTW